MMIVRNDQDVSDFRELADPFTRIFQGFVFSGVGEQAKTRAECDSWVDENPNIWSLGKCAHGPDAEALEGDWREAYQVHVLSVRGHHALHRHPAIVTTEGFRQRPVPSQNWLGSSAEKMLWADPAPEIVGVVL